MNSGCASVANEEYSAMLAFKPVRSLRVLTILLGIACYVLSVPLVSWAQDAEPISVPAAKLDATFVADWMQLLYNQVMAEGLSAPEASRVYAYTSIALWEAILPGMPGKNSMAGQLNAMPDMPLLPDEKAIYDWPTSAESALEVVSSGLLTSPASKKAFEDRLAQHIDARTKVVGADVTRRSAEFGQAVGKQILAWADGDNYKNVKNKPYVPLSKGEASFVLATPGAKAVEPYWGQLRAFALQFNSNCDMHLKLNFSADPASDFYAQAMEVRDAQTNLTPEQKAMADFWIDTPGITGTLAGHWMMIGVQLIGQKSLTLERAAGMFVMIGVSAADAFISAWGLKYEMLMLRPETYVQRYIERSWSPYIQTPPFPEYPSEQAVVSAAVAEVLTDYFGMMAFTDNTYASRNLPARKYTSFEAATSEAAISRLYGGIDFRFAIENGLRQGQCVGRNVIERALLQPLGNT
jgi:hypothetical protein